MKSIYLFILPFILFTSTSLCAQTGQSKMSFVVSMDQPSSHYFHVEFRCEGISEQTMDLKMPAWTPGYYMILDLAKYVINFQAVDDMGNALVQRKIDKNTWRIKTNNSPVVKLSYDVFAYVQSVSRPYRHYTFLIMGEGMGGLEHRNSMAVFSSGGRYGLTDPEGYKSWLAFLAHEYFHLYNVKAIRPVALGPFDYDRENYTNMLWFSEGVTVYYEYLILNRAGFLNSEESLERIQTNITNYESIPGHLFQPVTMTSFDTWIQFFNRSENASNTTISYYDKGCALVLLLDLKIRHETKNEKSLDDIMRILYYDFYKEKGRGFTDQEFQDVCEKTAGCSLNEIFEYASTTKAIDYPKYLAYAGLDIDTALHIKPGVQLGIDAYEREGNLIISNVEWNSPAWYTGLSPRDTIIELNDTKASSLLLDEICNSVKPGDEIQITVGRRTGRCNLEVIPESKQQRTFDITRLSQPDPYQAEI